MDVGDAAMPEEADADMDDVMLCAMASAGVTAADDESVLDLADKLHLAGVTDGSDGDSSDEDEDEPGDAAAASDPAPSVEVPMYSNPFYLTDSKVRPAHAAVGVARGCACAVPVLL